MLHFKNKNRREFIKSCLRFSVGGGLVFTGIALGLRKKTDSTENDLCQLRTPCRGCSKYNSCSLPRAQNVKNNARGEGSTSGRK